MLLPDLLNKLVCPVCKGGLHADDDDRKLLCYPCNLAFPVRDGIPVMLTTEAESIMGQGIGDKVR